MQERERACANVLKDHADPVGFAAVCMGEEELDDPGIDPAQRKPCDEREKHAVNDEHPLADHHAGKAVHGDGATGDTGDKRVGLGRGDAPIPTEEAPTYGSYHRGYEGHERLVRVTREVDHVEHGMGYGCRDVRHAHEADEVEDGCQNQGRAWLEAARRNGRSDGIGGIGSAVDKDDPHNQGQQQRLQQMGHARSLPSMRHTSRFETLYAPGN